MCEKLATLAELMSGMTHKAKTKAFTNLFLRLTVKSLRYNCEVIKTNAS